LCGAFLAAACGRRERGLFVSFDERAEETVRNLRSINVNLQPHIDSGQLALVSSLSHADSAKAHLLKIRTAIRQHRATCVVIDPVSALANSGEGLTAEGILSRFIYWAKLNGITLICTSLLSGADPNLEATELGVSTLSDTWIHLAYAQRDGERNRSITVIKSRGTAHSNQVRELILSDKGIALADVYEAGGHVLMGAMRAEQESVRRDEDLRRKAAARKKRLEVERAGAEIKARAEMLKREMAINEVDLQEAKRLEAARIEKGTIRRKTLPLQRRTGKKSS
jgi:circadian clock protein KaiC